MTRIEAVLLSLVVLMITVSVLEASQGNGVGNEDKIKLAKLQAQQELMAQRIDLRY